MTRADERRRGYAALQRTGDVIGELLARIEGRGGRPRQGELEALDGLIADYSARRVELARLNPDRRPH